jgi:hypothetical protein
VIVEARWVGGVREMDNDVAVKEDAVGRVVRRSGMEMEEDFIVVGVVWFFVLPLILVYWWSTNNKSQRCGLLWLWVVVSFWVVLFPVRVINLPVMKLRFFEYSVIDF